MIFTRIFLTVFPVFAISLVGYLYGRKHRPEMSVANQLNVDIFIPALVFSALSDRDFELARYTDLALGATIIVLGSGLLLLPLVRLAKINLKTFLPPMMFNNSGNMGLPLALLAFGEEALPAAVVLFIVENGLHFSVGAYMMDHRAGLMRLLRNPIVLASLSGIGVSLLKIPIPEFIAIPIDMLGKVSIPLLLFALGVRLVDVDLSHWRIGLLGAILCPLSGVVIALPLISLLTLDGTQVGMLLLFSALPPAVLNYIVAEQYQQEPDRVAAIVMMGNLASLITIPTVLYFALS